MSKHLKHCESIVPPHVGGDISVVDLVDRCFLAHNARSLRDACQLFSHIADSDTLVGVSLSGALSPAGVLQSSLIPLVRAGFVDFIISTGANLYHDMHQLLGFEMKMAPAAIDDITLREEGVIRIHNVLFDQQALFDTDAFVREVFRKEKVGTTPPTSTLNRVLGEELRKRFSDASDRSLLACAAEHEVPVYTPAFSDSSIGMNLAALRLAELPVGIDPLADVNETAAMVYDAKAAGRKTAAVIFGGGVAKNFLLQTEPHIQEVLGLQDVGHDYFLQFTDARIDTGGLSGATPSEAVTWGKVDPGKLTETVVCYGDCSIYVPIMTAYVLAKGKARQNSRLLASMDRMVGALRQGYRDSGRRD